MMAHASWRGDSRMRVAIELRARSARVRGIWALAGPAVQRQRLSGTHLAQVLVGSATALIQSFDSPLRTRGSSRRDRPGHSFGDAESATVYVDIPLRRGEPIGILAIRLTDISDLASFPTQAGKIESLMSTEELASRIIAEIDHGELSRHADWANASGFVSGEQGVGGQYEIYRDREARFRWRLRRPDGEIVADSGQGYDSRAECEADLRWIRQYASQVPIRSLDLPGTEPVG